LHSINTSAGAFQTRDPEKVEAFAREWGFIPTAYTTLSTVAEVREFTENISKNGKRNGEPIEGFVVRTHIADSPLPAEGSGRPARDRDAPPYPPGSSFFFKVKFDEPYMMYRDWRELTKSLLAAKAGTEPRISKAKLNRPETRLYRTWVEGEIKRDRKAFDGYTQNQGIIATRERFLKWCEGEGMGNLAQEAEKQTGTVGTDRKKVEFFGKTIVIPVAIPGCGACFVLSAVQTLTQTAGKTSTAVALKHLFGCGHTQSDDIKAKKPAPVFLQNVKNLLMQHDVVITDKQVFSHIPQSSCLLI
jgi:tRNA ligase